MGQSIPWMVALVSYLELMYFHTSENRADGPTRGKEIRAADDDLPDWWYALAQEDFQSFDVWRFEQGLDDVTLSGLPSFAELCGSFSPVGILPKFLAKEQDESEAAGEASGGEVLPLPSSTSSARPRKGTVKCGRGEPLNQEASEALEEYTAPVAEPACSEACHAQKARQTKEQEPQRARRPQKQRRLPPKLSPAARELLAQFPEDQIVRSSGVMRPPVRAGFLDVFFWRKRCGPCPHCKGACLGFVL
eukprot:s66_g33.t1